MKLRTRVVSDESGVAHLLAIVIVALFVGVAGFGAFRIMNMNKDEAPQTASQSDQVQDNDDAENTDSKSDSEMQADEKNVNGDLESDGNEI